MTQIMITRKSARNISVTMSKPLLRKFRIQLEDLKVYLDIIQSLLELPNLILIKDALYQLSYNSTSD